MSSESFGGRVEAVFTSWEEAKLFFEQATAVSTESLHIIGGVLILFGAAALFRKPVSSRAPWLVVLAFTCFNEFIDLSISQWPHPGMQFGESVKDVFLTMLLPSILLFTANKTPGLYSRKAPAIAADQPAAGSE
jgi:hypothetical protein